MYTIKVKKTSFIQRTSDDIGAKMMFCVEGEESTITLLLGVNVKAVVGVKVDGQTKNMDNTYAIFIPNNPVMITFPNLVNGFTTEVSLILQ